MKVAGEAILERALPVFEALVAFDTTSRLSNLDLIAFVEARLKSRALESRRIANADGSKANLLACVGPRLDGGVVLSGHTDVVPIDGQAWTSPPFRLTRRGERLFGRGACDMKGFIALALAAAELADPEALRRPLQLAFSYDEEIGCLGAPDMIDKLAELGPRPSAVIVGEPTSMEIVTAHKGISVYRVCVEGREAHSSQTHLGASAVSAAIPILSEVEALARRLAEEADPASPFTPKETTVTVGLVNGGTAGNILARRCEFQFDVRNVPGDDPERLVAGVRAAAAEADRALRARFADAGARIERAAAVPPLQPEPDGRAEPLARSLAGANGPARVVAFAAEAGQFQRAGFSTVICGPGSIDQAHQADEYVDLDQMRRGAEFMSRLLEELST